MKHYLPLSSKTYQKQEEVRIFKIGNIKKFKKRSKNFKLKINPRIKKLNKIRGVNICLVAGDKIRKFLDVDFTSGGHGYRYLYIPLNEIWIDNALNKEDILPTIWHEFVERHLMERGVNYNKAHDHAASLEISIRNKKEFVLPLINVNQFSNYSCGASALQIVFEYLGKKISEKEVMKMANTSPKKGTDVKDMVKTAKRLGFKTLWKQHWKIEDIKKTLMKGLPIIANFQLSSKYGEGHYAIIIGFTKNELIMSDPSSDKEFIKIKIKKFMKQWYELEDKTTREGIVIF